MSVLVINSGSSSIKFAVFDETAHRRLASGGVERIGEERGEFSLKLASGPPDAQRRALRIDDHASGFDLVFDAVGGIGEGLGALEAIGHRVVHGGEAFTRPARIDAEVLRAIADVELLAPLHNPANRRGIEVAMERCPELPQVAVFDTAFHQTLPEHAWRYAVPEDFYRRHQVRRFGFHGTSHRYLARRAAELLGRPPEAVNLITLHLGNGASATAIRDGRSVDTSMGFTPLEGLVMGTRCGDLDAAVPLHLLRHSDAGAADLERALNQDSGLKGLAGVNDMRELKKRRAAGDRRAELAIDLFCYRVRKYLGAYCAVLGSVDAVVFSGGIGENHADVREQCCTGLELLGIRIDVTRNAAAGDGDAVHSAGSRVAVLVVRTDEEREIASETLATLAD